jgi:hypothetical protein
MRLLEKIIFEDNLYEPVSYELVKSADAKKYIDDIAANLSSIEKEIVGEQDGKIIVMLEEGGFNYSLNGFNKNLMKKILQKLEEGGISET